MKNTMSDLNNHLFMQLERLNDESMSEDKLRLEIERSKAMSLVASQVISNARTVLEAIAIKGDLQSAGGKALPAMLECK